jgi:hypothetical protein
VSQTQPHPPISFVAFGVAMLAFAACSGGGGGSSPTPVTQTSAAPGTANTTASPAANATAQGASPAPGASSATGTATASASPAATASLPTFSLTGVNAKTYTETPFRALDVSNSFGVNVDLSDISSANVAPTASLLKSLGITHVRIGLLKNDASYDSTVSSFLSQSGASALGITNCIAPLGPSLSSGITASDIATFNSAIGGKLEGYEAMNEPDAQASADPLWVQNLESCMQQQENAIAGVPFVGPAISNELAYASDVGNQTSIINYGNFHRYLSGHNPDTPGYGGTYSCGVYGALNWAICEAQIVSGSEPLTITEQGYSTTNEVDQTTQAKYLSRAFFVNANAGIARTYVYTLTSYTGGDAFGGDGILNTDLSTKPAYTAIQSTLGELSDTAEGSAPASITYAIVGAPSTLEHQLIEKSNGSYVLVLWNETPSWNTTTSVPITVAPTNVTVAFTFPVTSVKATSLSDAGSPTTPNSITLATNGIIVPVDDHLTFITFSKLL